MWLLVTFVFGERRLLKSLAVCVFAARGARALGILARSGCRPQSKTAALSCLLSPQPAPSSVGCAVPIPSRKSLLSTHPSTVVPPCTHFRPCISEAQDSRSPSASGQSPGRTWLGYPGCRGCALQPGQLGPSLAWGRAALGAASVSAVLTSYSHGCTPGPRLQAALHLPSLSLAWPGNRGIWAKQKKGATSVTLCLRGSHKGTWLELGLHGSCSPVAFRLQLWVGQSERMFPYQRKPRDEAEMLSSQQALQSPGQDWECWRLSSTTQPLGTAHTSCSKQVRAGHPAPERRAAGAEGLGLESSASSAC